MVPFTGPLGQVPWQTGAGRLAGAFWNPSGSPRSSASPLFSSPWASSPVSLCPPPSLSLTSGLTCVSWWLGTPRAPQRTRRAAGAQEGLLQGQGIDTEREDTERENTEESRSPYI